MCALARASCLVAMTWTSTVQAAGIKELASLPNKNAGAELFIIDGDDSIKHLSRKGRADGWSGFEPLHGLGYDIAAIELQPGRFEVFVAGTDGMVWSNRQLAAQRWAGFSSFGQPGKRVAVAKAENGRYELFATAADDTVWRSVRAGPDGDWSAWQSLGGQASQLAAAQAADGSVYVFAVERDHAVWFTPSDHAGWQSLGGLAQDIAVGRSDAGQLTLFVVGSDDSLWRMRSQGSSLTFDGWQSLERPAKRVAASSGSSGNVAYALGTGSELLQQSADRWREVGQGAVLETRFFGVATMEIPSLNVKQTKHIELGVRFSADRRNVAVTSFPAITTKRFSTPFGGSQSTITLVGGGQGSLDPQSGQIQLPVTLHFDQSLDVPLIQEDADVALALTTSGDGARVLDLDSGQVALRAESKFQGRGGINPLNRKSCRVTITGAFVAPGSLLRN
jgi:hypothetical protein